MYNPRRAHKILPLLEEFVVDRVRGWKDLLRLKRSPGLPTVVVTDGFRSRALFGIISSLLLGAPLVIRLRGEYFREERQRTEALSDRLRWPRHLGLVLLARLCFWRARAVICNSEYLARAMAPYIRGKVVSIVHNPCTVPDPTFFGQKVPEFPDGGFRLLTVTNMNLRSKIQPLAEAVGDWIPPELWEEMDLRWVICGSGSHEGRLRALIRERGLDERVRMLGRVENVSAAYEWCSVLVHPTRMDAFPNVPMEAMAHGKPVITNADSCGTREQVFDGGNGFVVEDAGSFLAALRAYAANPKLRERHGRAGKLLVERKFSVEAQRRAMRHALERMVSRARGGAKV